MGVLKLPYNAMARVGRAVWLTLAVCIVAAASGVEEFDGELTLFANTQ